MSSENKIIKFARLNISLLTIGAIISAFRQIKKPVSSHLVKTEDADFLMLTGVHGVGKFGQQIDLAQDVSRLDAAFLETGAFHYIKKDKSSFKFPKKRMEKMAFYSKLIPLLRRQRVPILFGDIPFGVNTGLILSIIDSAATFGSIIGGLQFAFDRKSKNIISPLFGGALSLWGFLGLAKRLAVINPDFIRHKNSSNIRRLALSAEIAHPQDALVTFRNAVISAKLLNYAQQLKRKIGRKPTIAIAMGSGHELISDYLCQGADFSQKVLNAYPKFIKRLLVPYNIRHYYPALVEAIFTKGRYQVNYFNDLRLNSEFHS